MEEKSEYIVEITPEAEHYYFKFLEYLYEHHSSEHADRKSEELLSIAESLNRYPYRGEKEEQLSFLGKDYRFLLYAYTPRKTIKIIYFIAESEKKVYVTDFFPTEMNQERISQRSGFKY